MRLITGGGDVGSDSECGFSSGLGGLKLYHRVVEARTLRALATFLELLAKYSQLRFGSSSSPSVHAFLRERGVEGYEGSGLLAGEGAEGARKRQLALDSESDTQRRSPVTTPQIT